MFPQYVFMVGIGGIGMSAFAQYLRHAGVTVSGSDRDISPTTELLESKGITVHIGNRADVVPLTTELLIYSDAVWPDNPERTECARRNIPQISYFEALGRVSTTVRTIAVAGTHGKTTTTGMLAKMLVDGGSNPTAIIGSIVRDFGSNFVAGSDKIFVVEACEYRDHLLELSPEILVLTNVEWDHTDFFPSLEALQSTFRKALARVPQHGVVVTNPTHLNIAPLLVGVTARIVDYTSVTVPELTQIGDFNKDNARAAKAVAMLVAPQVAPSVLDLSLKDFKGSWRRFEYKGVSKNGAVIYDDYAHHPTAVEKTIQGCRERFVGKKIVVVFHPHLYSRTKSFLTGFADALKTADRVIVAPIYAAREKLDPTVSHEILVEKIIDNGGTAEAMNTFPEIIERLQVFGSDTLILTMGAGDIYKVAEEIVHGA